MEELYRIIEEKIKASGYPGEVDGFEFYEDINAEAEEKENGTYIFMINKEDNIRYEGCIEIMDENFDLHYVDIFVDEEKYHVDFDNWYW